MGLGTNSWSWKNTYLYAKHRAHSQLSASVNWYYSDYNEEKTGRGEDLKEGNKRNKNGGWRKEEEKGGKGRKSGEKDPKRDMHPENENFQRWNHSDRQ